MAKFNILDLPSRIQAKIVIDNATECWLWVGTVSNKGYGVSYDKRLTPETVNYRSSAHRLVYKLLVSDIPKDKEIDHLCRVRRCVNPEHLEAVYHIVNIRRGEAGKYFADKTHCPQGHPYDAANTVINSNKGRHCRKCQTNAAVKYRERKRSERVKAVKEVYKEPVTAEYNSNRGIGGTHCILGHPFSEKNTYFVRGERVCRECSRERVRKYRARLKEEKNARKTA